VSTATLLGTSIIGTARAPHAGPHFHAVNPATGEAIAPEYSSASLAELERAVALAAEAVPVMTRLSGSERAAFLRAIASNIEALGQDLFDRVMHEAGLPLARVQGETGRTCSQLRMFAELAAEGSWVDARIDRADPNRKPARKPDLRSMLRPLGPVAVFGASNFPLAFSVAGGDTASAFAAGNPVVVKAHPAHPGTSEMVGGAVQKAVRECGLPEGAFSLLYDSGYQVATALVKHPVIQAVGFTGSRKGGRALMNATASRPDPIPFYAEMSSVNPFFFLPGAFGEGWEERVAGLLVSLTTGSGQFCTKPGLVFLEASGHAQAFTAKLREMLAAQGRFTMLTPDIGRAYTSGVAEHRKHAGVSTLLCGESESNGAALTEAALFLTDARSYLANPRLREEVFGPAAVLITYSGRDELLKIAHGLEGQLTATVHGSLEDFETHAELLAILETKVGRLICNGFPTGVEVGHAVVHGGPWPATSDSRSTSVGTRAVVRFARPVCYQDFPQASLPGELKDDNPLGIWRLIDGRLTRD
jgi:NADP-dependent aldehyde dehydrogenase